MFAISGFYPPNLESKLGATSAAHFWAQVFPLLYFQVYSPFPFLGFFSSLRGSLVKDVD